MANSLLFRIIRDFVKPQRNKIILAVICMVFASGSEGMLAYLVQPMLDKIFLQQDKKMLNIIIFAIVGATIAKALFSYLQTLLMSFIGQRIVTDMQIKLYNHLLRSDIVFLQSFSSGRLITRFSNDINLMRNMVSTSLTGFVKELLSVVILTGIMFYQNWQLALIAFASFPLAIYPIVRLGKRMRKIARANQEELGHYIANLDDNFQNIKIVKAYNNEKYEALKAENHMNKIFKYYFKAAKIGAASSPIVEILGGVALALVIWYGGVEVIMNETTAGKFFSFMTALFMAYKPARGLANINTSLQEGLAAGKRLFDLLDIKPEITDLPGAQEIKNIRGDIKFSHITFGYNYEPIIKDFNLEIKAGQTIAIVGPSGSGKSTLLNLLLRFYMPEQGEIYIDDYNIKEVTLASLRRSVAIVMQEANLFDNTILENINYGNLSAGWPEILQAARMAEIDFVGERREDFEARIGQHGVKLSGGQKQRIAIARALIKNSAILILDEASSALDNITESKVFANIMNMRKGKTNIIIAHRLSTITKADKIYVMEKGKIIESGTHSDLLNQKALYYKLYQKQEETLNYS